MNVRAAFATLLLHCIFLTSGVLARESTLPPAVTRALQRTGVPPEHLSIYVRDASTDDVLLEWHADQPRSPASTIKVLTTFAALELLGPAYAWKTRAYAAGKVENGILHGDLVLVGGGDPYMTAERWWSFVHGLRARGIAKITGDIVIDNSYFAPIAGTRADFDSQPYRAYNVLPDALMVNFQTARFTVLPESGKSPPQISIWPRPAQLEIKNRLRLGPGKCANTAVRFDSPPEASLIELSGVIAGACGTYSIDRAIMTATDFAYGTFHTFWKESGGVFEGTLRLERLPSDAKLLYEFESIPLAEVVRLVNKFSNNVMARHLLITLGAERMGVPASALDGDKAIRAWLEQRGIVIPGLVIDNGSGLSRTERITVRGLGEMLDTAWHSPFMPEFAASLPLAATDGTLRQRFRIDGMPGRLRLKTGRLDDVTGLAGYVNSASGKTFVVVILVNHPGAHLGSGEAVQAELIRWVFSR